MAERYLEVLANRPSPEGLWKRTKPCVRRTISTVFSGIHVTLRTFSMIEETIVVEHLAKDPEKKFEVIYATGSTVMEISSIWNESEVTQEMVRA